MNFSFHFQSCLKLQQNHNWGNITSFFLFYTIYKTLLNYVQDIRLSRPENYIMFLGCHTDINVLMSSKNNIVQLTFCYFSLCFEDRNGLWDFKGFVGYKNTPNGNYLSTYKILVPDLEPKSSYIP